MTQTQKYFAALLVFAASCSPATLVKPLKKGEDAVSVNLGGPLIGLGDATVPVPLSGITYAHGWKDKLTVFGRLHTTSALFGVAHLEPGLLWQVHEQRGWLPALSIGPSMHFMLDRWEGNGRIYPQIDCHGWWRTSAAGDSLHDHFLYAGFSNWIEWRKTGTAERAQENHWLPTFQIGHSWCNARWRYTLEARYIAPFTSNTNIVVDYKVVGNSGAFGTYFSITRTF